MNGVIAIQPLTGDLYGYPSLIAKNLVLNEETITNEHKPLRILFAPHGIDGQMQLMVETLMRRGHYALLLRTPRNGSDTLTISDKNSTKTNAFRKHLRVLSF